MIIEIYETDDVLLRKLLIAAGNLVQHHKVTVQLKHENIKKAQFLRGQQMTGTAG